MSPVPLPGKYHPDNYLRQEVMFSSALVSLFVCLLAGLRKMFNQFSQNSMEIYGTLGQGRNQYATPVGDNILSLGVHLPLEPVDGEPLKSM